MRQHSSKLDHLKSKSLQNRDAYLAEGPPWRDPKDEQPALEVTGVKLCIYDFGEKPKFWYDKLEEPH